MVSGRFAHFHCTLARALLLWAVGTMTSAAFAQTAHVHDDHEGPDVRVDGSVLTDSNVTRSNIANQRLSDTSIGVLASYTHITPISTHARMIFNGLAGLEMWRRFHGLGKAYAGAEVEWQYRGSAAFDAPTFALQWSTTAENYQSELRDGARSSVGASVFKPLTDRIDLQLALRRNLRDAESAVFETQDTALRANLDYAFSQRSTLYFSSEFRRGDFVSSGLPSLANLNLAKVLVPDDALRDVGYNSYRVRGRTTLLTLGYNRALGTRESLDLSWRHVRSTPSTTSGIPGSGPAHYTTNQIALVYLTTF